MREGEDPADWLERMAFHSIWRFALSPWPALEHEFEDLEPYLKGVSARLPAKFLRHFLLLDVWYRRRVREIMGTFSDACLFENPHMFGHRKMASNILYCILRQFGAKTVVTLDNRGIEPFYQHTLVEPVPSGWTPEMNRTLIYKPENMIWSLLAGGHFEGGIHPSLNPRSLRHERKRPNRKFKHITPPLIWPHYNAFVAIMLPPPSRMNYTRDGLHDQSLMDNARNYHTSLVNNPEKCPSFYLKGWIGTHHLIGINVHPSDAMVWRLPEDVEAQGDPVHYMRTVDKALCHQSLNPDAYERPTESFQVSLSDLHGLNDLVRYLVPGFKLDRFFRQG
jgi:hypothetical protein